MTAVILFLLQLHTVSAVPLPWHMYPVHSTSEDAAGIPPVSVSPCGASSETYRMLPGRYEHLQGSGNSARDRPGIMPEGHT